MHEPRSKYFVALTAQGPMKEGLEIIVRESQRCKIIIQEMLEFARDR
jgi:signal transduction histidine kinase